MIDVLGEGTQLNLRVIVASIDGSRPVLREIYSRNTLRSEEFWHLFKHIQSIEIQALLIKK